MKIIRFLILVVISTALLIACTTSPAAQPTSMAGTYLLVDYTDAATIRSQLAYGIMKLDGTANAVTAEQAKTLIPLWQAVIALSGDTTTATEELTAVQDQIAAALTPEQLQAIAAMQLTNADLNVFYADYGITLPTPIPGVTKVPGSGSGKTEEEKVAAQATAAASGQTAGSGQAARTLLFEKAIEYLTGLVN